MCKGQVSLWSVSLFSSFEEDLVILLREYHLSEVAFSVGDGGIKNGVLSEKDEWRSELSDLTLVHHQNAI